MYPESKKLIMFCFNLTISKIVKKTLAETNQTFILILKIGK